MKLVKFYLAIIVAFCPIFQTCLAAAAAAAAAAADSDTVLYSKAIVGDENLNRIKVLLTQSLELSSTDIEKSLEYGFQALELGSQLEDSTYYVLAHERIGIAYSKHGKHDSSLIHYEIALDYFKSKNNREGIVRIYTDIATSSYLTGKMDEATYYNIQSIEIAEKEELDELAQKAYNNLGNIYRDQRKFEKAKEYFFKSIRIRQDLNLDKQAEVWMNIGTVYFESGNADSAIYYQKKAHQTALKEGNIRTAIESNLNRALAYTLVPDYQRALEVYEHEKANMAEEVDISTLAKAYVNMGALYYYTHQYDKAISHLNEAMKYANELDNGGIKLAVLKIKSRTFIGQLDYKSAYETAQHTIRLRDSIHTTSMQKNTDRLLAEHDAKLKEQRIKELELEQELKEQRIKANEANLSIQRYFIAGIALVSLILSLIVVLVIQQKRKQEITSRVEINQALHEIEQLKNQHISNPDFSLDLKGNNIDETVNEYLLSPLTERELEVLELIAQGKSNKEIASDLFISANTAKTHISKIYDKLEVKNRTQAARKAGRLQLLN